MAGIIVQLIISWLLLWLIEKKNILALGIAPTGEHIKQFGFGFCIGLVFLSCFFLLTAYLVNHPHIVNPAYSVHDFLGSVRYVVQSVLFEELIFRGAILYILIRRVGPVKATLVSTVAFGIYHWFSFNLFGQPMNMILIFVGTGLMGYVLALAFYRTKSLYLPIALHLGYNFTSMIIFSSDKSIGPQLLIRGDATGIVDPGSIVSLFVTLVYFTGFPLLAYLYVRRIDTKDKDSVVVGSTI